MVSGLNRTSPSPGTPPQPQSPPKSFQSGPTTNGLVPPQSAPPPPPSTPAVYIDVSIIIVGASVGSFNGREFAGLVAEVLALPYSWVQIMDVQASMLAASQRRMALRRLHTRAILQQSNLAAVNVTTRVYSDHMYNSSGSSPSTIDVFQSVVNNGTLSQHLNAVHPSWNVTQVRLPVNSSSTSSSSSGTSAGAIAGAAVGAIFFAGTPV